MKNTKQLDKVVLDKGKLGGLVQGSNAAEIKALLGIKDSQLANIKRGYRGPSTDGLIRLMLHYKLTATDLAKTD